MELRLGPRRRSPRLLALGGADLISTLPDDLLLLILARLPCASAAARTGVLSRRWRGLWARLRRIVFSDVVLPSLEAAVGRFPPPPPEVSLIQIRIPKPRGPVPNEHRADTAISSLLRAAASLDPEELSLVLPSRFVVRSFRLQLPCFHRATSLVLDLCSTVRCVPPAAEFPALETLSLSRCSADLESLLSRCPRLRALCIGNVSIRRGFLSIKSPLLQELVVARETWIRDVIIVAPVLTQMAMSLSFSQVGDVSVLAPMVDKISWDCYLSWPQCFSFGVWRVMKMSLQKKAESHGQLHIHASIRPATIYGGQQNFGEAENFTQEIQKHMIAEFAIFELHLNPRGHVFGALAFRLLGINQVSSAMQRLKVILTRSTIKEECPLDCPCEPWNWRSQSITFNALEEVEVSGFKGVDDHEIVFLNLIFKYAPMLQRITVILSHEVSSRNDECTEIYNIFRAYSSVECYVYLSSGLIHGSQNCPST